MNKANFVATENMSDFELRVKLFGAVELENKWGTIVENRARQPLPWLLLKYLLANPRREVGLDELLDTVWPVSENGSDIGAARVRLRRLRESLEPLHLDGKKGLVLYCDGAYSLNPKYEIRSDADDFLSMLTAIRRCSLDNHGGLSLCMDALRLYRGQFMEHTENDSWLLEYRDSYQQEFSVLARDTLKRTILLENDSAITLLCRRTAAIIPEDGGFHNELIGYLIERGRQVELMRHISQLTRTGKSQWLDSEH